MANITFIFFQPEFDMPPEFCGFQVNLYHKIILKIIDDIGSY